jgi:hypothetical protein
MDDSELGELKCIQNGENVGESRSTKFKICLGITVFGHYLSSSILKNAIPDDE